MQNTGEEIVGEYLKLVKGCDFIEYNFYTPDVQGEIDVVGINIKLKSIYLCEVAVHLVTGLQYGNPKTKRPDNVNRFVKKFSKNIEYANKYFNKYKKYFMLWSPVVKNQKAAKYNQCDDIKEIVATIKNKYNVKIEPVINSTFKAALSELRTYAAKETKELKSPVMRYLQIEERLARHLRLMDKTR